MEIKERQSNYLSGIKGSMILDNAYDLHNKNKYIQFYQENNVNYIFFQDNDLSLLSLFPDLEIATVPDDSYNLENLYSLYKLEGLEISAQLLKKVDLSQFPCLKQLIIHGELPQEYKVDCCKINRLVLTSCTKLNFSNFFNVNNIEELEIVQCRGLITLDSVANFLSLRQLVLDYCLKLEDISSLVNVAKTLKILRIEDCNKIKDFQVLYSLLNLETLYLTTFETSVVNTIPSISFVKRLSKLKKIMTDFKIIDGDLLPLKVIDEVDVLRFYKHYNLQKI